MLVARPIAKQKILVRIVKLEYLDIHKHVNVCRATLYVRKQATFALLVSVSVCVIMLPLLLGPEMIATKVTCYTKIEAAHKQATGAKPTSANTLQLLSRLCLKLPSLQTQPTKCAPLPEHKLRRSPELRV